MRTLEFIRCKSEKSTFTPEQGKCAFCVYQLMVNQRRFIKKKRKSVIKAGLRFLISCFQL